MKVFITGITGSCGTYLAEYLAPDPHNYVCGIARNAPDHWTCATTDAWGIRCDMNDREALQDVLAEVDPDIIFNLASMANVRQSWDQPSTVLANNVLATSNLFDAVLELGTDPLIVHCSTSEVYGTVSPEHVPITEDCPLSPANPYAISKLVQDGLAYIYSHATWHDHEPLRIIRTRAFGYINPRRADLFATSFARQIAEIEVGQLDVLLHGNLDSIRTLLDVRDVVEAYWLAALKCEPGQVYNIGSTEPVTVGRLLYELTERAKVRIVLRGDPKLLRPLDVTNQVPCVDKFRAATGWEARYTLGESLDFLLTYWRERVRVAA